MTEKSKESNEIIFIKNLFDNRLSDVNCTKILTVAKGDLVAFKFKIENNIIRLIHPRINKVIASKE